MLSVQNSSTIWSAWKQHQCHKLFQDDHTLQHNQLKYSMWRGRKIKNSYFLSTKVLFFCFLLAVVVSASENTCIEMFFNKFESNIEKFKAVSLEFFNITWEQIFSASNLWISSFLHGMETQQLLRKKYWFWLWRIRNLYCGGWISTLSSIFSCFHFYFPTTQSGQWAKIWNTL